MSIEAIRTLCEVRLAAERQAEQELGRAIGAHQRVRDAHARLIDELAAAQARRESARVSRLTPGTAAAVQVEQRWAARLQGQARAAAEAVEVHARGALAEAAGAEARAREQHARARQRRDAVERALARRVAAARRDQDRRAEIAADDLALRRR